MRTSLFLCLTLSTVVFLSLSSAAQGNGSDPQAVSLLNKSIAALGASSATRSIHIDAELVFHIPPGPQTGYATIEIASDGQSSVEMDLPGGKQVETTGPQNSISACQLTGKDGQLHNRAVHNCLLSVNKFLPVFGTSSSRSRLTLAPHSHSDQPAIVVANPSVNPDEAAAQLLTHLSTVSLTFDPSTNLPVSMTYNEHPEKDAKTDIPVEIRYSNYRSVDGVMIPQSIQKYINGGLVFEMDVESVSINPAAF